MYSGADLVRRSGQHAEQVGRFKILEPVAAVTPPDAGESTLDGDTRNALLRFAKFVRQKAQNEPNPDEGHRKKKPESLGLHPAYVVQIEALDPNPPSGNLLDIYI